MQSSFVRRALLSVVSVLSAFGVFGQSLDSLRITLQTGREPLSAVFKKLENDYALRIYVAPQSLPAGPVEAAFEGVLLSDALRQLLRNTGLDFFFYRDFAVAIAPRQVIEAVYSPDFYRVLQETAGRPAAPEDSSITRTSFVGDRNNIAPSGRATLRGQVVDDQTGEPLANAAVVVIGSENQNAQADRSGRFSLTLPVGACRLSAQYLGYDIYETEIYVYNDGELTVRLAPAATGLTEVLIRAEAPDANVASARIGVAKIDPKAVQKMPTLLGEADVVRSLLLQTGVTSVGEGAAGFNVRGGDVDQNYMLLDEMILFSSTHALGFFSTYNPDLIGSIELYRSIMPAQFGGRLSSVADVQMRDGNAERWKVKAGFGPLTGRLSLEGPLVKGKSSLIAGARASYTDWALRLSKRLEVKRSSASFYDADFRYAHRLDDKNSLILAGHAAGDAFVYNREFGFDYRTLAGQLTYKHTFHSDFFSRLSLVAGDYSSRQSTYTGTGGGELDNGLTYFKAKEQLTWHRSRNLQLDAGLESVYYLVRPGEQRPLGPVSAIPALRLETERGLESAVFGSLEWTLSPRWTLTGGLRLNHYRYLGPQTVYTYDPTVAPGNISDTLVYGGGRTIARYSTLEPRLSGRYRIDRQSSLKAGYGRSSQFVNQIFNTDTPTPNSQYQLSTTYIRPFRAHNLAAGYFRNSENNEWEFSAEVFYRRIDQLWDYRDFARLTANDRLETEIRQGKGRAYGFEGNLKTTRQRVNGQLAYTFSRTMRRVPGVSAGNWYPGSADKPHNLSLVVNFQPTQRHTLTFNFTYSTGRPTTAPLTSYRLEDNLIVPVYAPRNQLRIPDYHRLDIAYTIGRGYNKRKTLKSTWNFSLYNVYARRNAFSVFFTQSPGQQPVANRLATLGTIFPAITLNIETL